MIALAYYLLKVTICSGLLFCYYHIALRNKLFHQWNRFYLLAAIILSLTVPCLEFNVLSATAESKSEAINLENIKILNAVQAADNYVAAANSGEASLSSAQWSIISYAAISAVMLSLLLLALLRIRSIIRSHSTVLIDDIKFVTTEEKDSPFTFFNYVFWNKNIELNTATGEHIFQHELVHVRDHHSVDKIFVQAVLVFFWCNPFFWLIKKELRMVHEFIADKKSVGQSDAHAFAAMILQATYPNQFNYLANHFFQSSIKRRLTMLTKKYNPKISYISRLLALPVIAFIVLAFTIKTKDAGKVTPLEKDITVVIDAGHGGGTGASAEGFTEDDLVLEIAKTIRDQNNNEKIKILLTRENKGYVDLKERVGFAKKNNADLFISIHLNANVPGAKNTEKNGIEVLIPASDPQKKANLLGVALTLELSKAYNTVLQSGRHTAFVLNNNDCPAALIECGYITDKDDRDFIIKKENQELIAQKILSAIELYAANNTTLANPIKPNLIDTTPKKASGMFFDTKNKIAIEFQEMIEAANPVLLTEALLIVNGERVPNDIFKTKTIVTNKLKFIEGKDAVRTYGQAASTGAVVFEGARYIDVPVTEYYKDIFYPKTPVKSDPDNIIFEKAQVEAEFPGGLEAWRRFLERNLNPQIPATNKAPKGAYTVITKFIVYRDGTISGVKALTKHGYGMEEEAVRAIKRGPKWVPAIQNGKQVTAYKQQPITFVVSDNTKL